MASIKEILEARENRWYYSNELLKKYEASLVVISLNIPGNNKSKESYNKCHELVSQEFKNLLSHFNILFEDRRKTADGPEAYFVVDAKGEDIKILSMDFEATNLIGRILDIDVRDRTRDYSRRDFGIEERKCILCNEPARDCIVTRKHSMEDLIYKIDRLMELYQEKQ